MDPDVNDGEPTVGGTEITVFEVAHDYEHLRYAPGDITSRRPDLTVDDVRAALSYYYDNVDEFRPDSETMK